jgi:hypothetical protein
VLILFGMLVFVFLAIAGLVIDMGVAQVTQAQMQAAVDSAAIEGCRWRNFDEGPGFSNREKRQNAVDIVRLAFDDDMYPTRGGYTPEGGSVLPEDDKDAFGFAAGPGLRVHGGTGDAEASATIGQQSDEDLARLDDPRLALNFNQNREYGDLVSGRYRPDRPHNEPADYLREDFEVASSLQNVHALSFLVRMRRSGSENPNDNVPLVSSSLPRLPFLFAMGSTMQRDESASGWNPRRDGLTVRATAIASARPAMRVGRPPCDEDGNPVYDHEDVGPGNTYRERISGLVPFYITKDAWLRHFTDDGWQSQSTEARGRVTVAVDGSIHLETGTTEFPTSEAVGQFMFGAGGDPCAFELGWPAVLGRAVTATSVTTPVRSFRFTKRKPAYIAIVDAIPDPLDNPVNRVIGYGFAHVWPVGYQPNEDPPAQYDGTSSFVISGGELIANPGVDCWMGQDNVSAHLNSAADPIVTPVLSRDEWIAVLAANEHLAYDLPTPPPGQPLPSPDPARIYDYTYIRRGTLLAPALTR